MFGQIIRESMTVILFITDKHYMNELFPFYSKLFVERIQKKFDNMKSKYRADLTQESEFLQWSCWMAIFACSLTELLQSSIKNWRAHRSW